MMLKPENDAEKWIRTPIFSHFQREHERTVSEIMVYYGHTQQGKPEPSQNQAIETPMVDEEEEEAQEGAQEERQEGEEEEAQEEAQEEEEEEEYEYEYEGEYEGEYEDEDEDEDDTSDDDDDVEGTRTPSGRQTGKTVSAKGRSALRPSRNEIPIEPPSSDSLQMHTDASPIEIRLKRRYDGDNVIVASGSQLKRRILCLSSESPLASDTNGYLSDAGAKASKKPAKGQSAEKFTAGLSMVGEDLHWKCTLDGPRCGHVVPNAKTRGGQDAIEQHYASHGRIMAEAMQTIDMESQAGAGGGYRINHLMDKIRTMSQKWEQSKPAPVEGLDE